MVQSVMTATHALEQVSVLVVDDEPDACALLQLVLQLESAEVRTASSVQEAIEAFLAEPPDVLVSDICMPGRDGYDLIRMIRSLPDDARDVPAIAVTAFPGSENRERALAAGYQAHLAKPFDPYEPVDIISRLVEH